MAGPGRREGGGGGEREKRINSFVSFCYIFNHKIINESWFSKTYFLLSRASGIQFSLLFPDFLKNFYQSSMKIKSTFLSFK